MPYPRARGRVIRRGRRPVRRRNYGKSKMKPLKGFNRLQSKTIRRALGRNEETKYSAIQLAYNNQVDPAIHTPGTDMLPLVPKLVLGTQENQRVGRKVTPTKCRVDINLGFAQTNVGGTSAPQYQDYANQVYVVLYLLRSKPYKNWQQFVASQSWANLIDNGDGTSTSFGYQVTPAGGAAFWTADTRDLQKPIETSEYTLLQKRIVKLTKNYGTIDQGLAAGSGLGGQPNMPQTSYRGSMTYRLPELQYDDTDSNMGGYPTNANLMLAIGWCYADNLGTYGIDATGTPFPPNQLINWTVRNHVWYKDG